MFVSRFDKMYEKYNLVELLKDCENGDFKLSHFRIGPDNIRAIVREEIPEGEYVKLTCRDEVVMSNTPMEQRTCLPFLAHAHGHVLVGGLGLGMILLAVQDSKLVKSITVVEKSKEVIDMIAHQLPLNDKVKIIEDDIFTYKPDRKFNTIWIDIWNYIDPDIYHDEMMPLMKRYRRFLVPKIEDEFRWIDCWAKLNARYDKPLVGPGKI